MDIEAFDEYQDLGAAIERAFIELTSYDAESDEYAQVVDQIVKLTKVRQAIAEMTLQTFEATEKQKEISESLRLKHREYDLKLMDAEKPDRVSMDTWAMVGANLAGIVMIIGYERFGVIATKALGFVKQLR